jgi:hypothetical protein
MLTNQQKFLSELLNIQCANICKPDKTGLCFSKECMLNQNESASLQIQEQGCTYYKESKEVVEIMFNKYFSEMREFFKETDAVYANHFSSSIREFHFSKDGIRLIFYFDKLKPESRRVKVSLDIINKICDVTVSSIVFDSEYFKRNHEQILDFFKEIKTSIKQTTDGEK